MQHSFFVFSKTIKIILNRKFFESKLQHLIGNIFFENNKFKLLSLLIYMIVGILLVSCNKKESSPVAPVDDNQFVGTWDLVGIKSVDQQGNVYEASPEDIAADPLTYILKSDKTGIQIYKGQNIDFNWAVQNNKFIATSQGSTQEYTYSLNSTTLTLTFKVTDETTNEVFTVTHRFNKRAGS